MALARCTLLALVAAAVVVTSWVARNAVRVGRPTIATNAGIDLWIGNHEGAPGAFVMSYSEALPIISTDLQVQERHDDRRGFELGWRFIREQPLDALGLLPRKWPLAAALGGGWTLVHLAFFGDPRFHLPVTPVMAVLAAPVWLWAAGLLRQPVVSRWRALRSSETSEGDRAAASQP